MTTLPDFGVDPGDVRRVILHWTAGGPTASDLDLKHYHAIIEYTGMVRKGKWSADDNISTSDGIYAAHTLHANTKAFGLALCGMRGAHESPLDYGPNPINEVQFRMAATVAAHVLWMAGVECDRSTALSHAEVETNLGIAQRGKWDISVLPWRADIRGARAVGDYWRSLIKAEMAQKAPIVVQAQDSTLTLRMGNRTPSSRVSMLQKALADHQYFTGKADGLFGPRTRASVMAFQADNNLTADGIVGPLTWEALNVVPLRPKRAVTVADLRDSGSKTIKAADTTEVSAMALGGAGTALTVLERVTGAEDTIASAQGILMAYWPVLLCAGVAGAGWYLARRLRLIRLADAVSGRNLGR